MHIRLLSCIAFVCSLANVALAQGTLGTELIARASQPMFATFAPGDRDHLFVAERNGLVRVLDLNTNDFLPDPLIDARSQTIVGTFTERGLLGMAFHPDFQQNGQFFLHMSDSAITGGIDHTAYIRRYEVQDGNSIVADPASSTTVLRFNQPQSNHNGGWIGFSPVDGFLYIATGDGGGGNDLGNGHTAGTGNSQDVSNNLLGKMLRIDVDGDEFPADANRNYAIPADNPFVNAAGDDEIYAYGLRNPFRSGFDRANGDLYVGDVGQNNWEEISFLAASTGGQNFGWRLREGFHATPTGGVGGAPPADNVDPIHEYGHVGAPNGGNVVTGGIVYRGPVEQLQGHYLFADFNSDQIWSFLYDGEMINDFQNRTSQLAPVGARISDIVAFAEDAVGNVYLLELANGDIWRITGPTATGDFNRDAIINRADAEILTDNLGVLSGATAETGDTNGDGDVDGRDTLNYLLAFGRSALDVPAGSTALNATQAAIVPEPATLSLVLLLGAFSIAATRFGIRT